MKAQGALITMVKPMEKNNHMEKNNAEKPSRSSAWMKGALYNLGKVAAMVAAENIVGGYAHPINLRGSGSMAIKSVESANCSKVTRDSDPNAVTPSSGELTQQI